MKSTLIELSKRLSEIETVVGDLSKNDVSDNNELTLETRAQNVRKFLTRFQEFFENGTWEETLRSNRHKNLNLHLHRERV